MLLSCYLLFVVLIVLTAFVKKADMLRNLMAGMGGGNMANMFGAQAPPTNYHGPTVSEPDDEQEDGEVD
jgi:hypothetical protein